MAVEIPFSLDYGNHLTVKAKCETRGDKVLGEIEQGNVPDIRSLAVLNPLRAPAYVRFVSEVQRCQIEAGNVVEQCGECPADCQVRKLAEASLFRTCLQIIVSEFYNTDI